MALGSINHGALEKAWKAHKFDFAESDRDVFEKYACFGLDDYMEKLELACKAQRDAHVRYKIFDWFEPIFKAVKLFVPAAESGLKATPIAGAGGAVLGGIVCLLSVAERLFEYQRRSMLMLEEIGASLKSLLLYEKVLYEDDLLISQALELVYGDILAFCSRAVHFIADKNDQGNLLARIKGFRFMTFQKFEDRLGESVDSFNKHMDRLKNAAHTRDQVRLMEIRTMAEKHDVGMDRAIGMLNVQHAQSEEILEYVRRIDAKTEQDRQAKATKAKLKANQRMLDSLSSLNFSKFYDEIRRKHVIGTGTWLLRHEKYQLWKNSRSSGLLWVKGKPGCGKSYLAGRTIQDLHLCMQSSDTYAYAICKREDRGIQSRLAILGSLAQQILIRQASLVASLEDTTRGRGGINSQDENSMMKTLGEAIRRSTMTYIVIDGLDECLEDVGIKLAQDLADLVHDQSLSPLKIIVFSRPDATFGERFGPIADIHPDHEEHNKDDLATYFDSEFDNENGKIPVTLEQREICLKKAQGMFQWIYLFRKSLEPLQGRGRRLANIENMPDGLTAIYDELLLSINVYFRPIASRIFLWITHGKRPLTGTEMREAVAEMADAKRLNQLGREPNDDCLVSICANLVFIDRDGYVRLIHDSVRTHLEDSPQLQATNQSISFWWRAEYQEILSQAHQRLSETCLDYLLLQDFEYGPATSERQLRLRQRQAPFLRYAASTWGWHVSQAKDSSMLINKIQKLGSSTSRRELCMQVYTMESEDRGFRTYNGRSHLLHLLSLVGLKDQAVELVPNAADLMRRESFRRFILIEDAIIARHHAMTFWLIKLLSTDKKLLLTVDSTVQYLSPIIHQCAAYGWDDVLECLMELDLPGLVDVVFGSHSDTPLLRACLENHLDAARVLIDHGADCNRRDAEGYGTLIHAVFSDNLAMLELILQHNVEVDMRFDNGWTPLQLAAFRAKPALVEALLAADANPLAEREEDPGRNTLHLAAEVNAAEVIQKIVLHHPDIDINKQMEDGNSPLHIAAQTGSWSAAAALIQLDCNINLENDDCQTPLFVAASNGFKNIVKLLVDKGTTLGSRAKSTGETAIHAAASSGQKGLLEYILRKQPPSIWKDLLDTPDNNESTAVHLSIIGGDLETLSFVLNAGADATKKTLQKVSSLHYAVYHGRTNMIQQLLSKAEDVNPVDETGKTPLHYAASKGSIEIVNEMLEFCAKEQQLRLDFNARDKSGSTPLHSALISNKFQMAELLLQHHAVSVKNSQGFFPIHLACRASSYQITKLLIDDDGIFAKGPNDHTALHNAVFSGQMPVIQLIAPKCITLLNAVDKAGNSAMMLALKLGHVKATQYLLDLGGDPSIPDSQGNDLLHVAVVRGGLELVKRLAVVGRDLTLRTKAGKTALLIAAEENKKEILQELMERGPEAVSILDNGEQGCQHAVANAIDDVALLQSLRQHELDLDKPDSVGQTPIHYAARGGSLQIIQYLVSESYLSYQADRVGNTPLMHAVFEGHEEVALFLIEKSANAGLNQWTSFSGYTEFTLAVAEGYLELIEPFLDAGADICHRDGTGLNAFDYAADIPHLQETLRCRNAGATTTSTAITTSICTRTIRLCWFLLTNLPARELELIETFDYQNIIVLLSESLRHSVDFDLYTVCVRARRWRPQNEYYGEVFKCRHCARKSFDGHFNVCKSCKAEYILCTECYEQYKKDGYPIALLELCKLEDEVRKVRKIFPASFGLPDVFMTISAFGRDLWIEKIAKKYDSWEQQHNATEKYASVDRPGQEFLRIIDSWQEVQDLEREDDTMINGSLKDSMVKLQSRFDQLNRQHSPSKLRSRLRCSGHEYIVIRKEPEDDLLDAGTGRLTNKFLDLLQAKYVDGQSLLDPSTAADSAQQEQEIDEISETSDIMSTSQAHSSNRTDYGSSPSDETVSTDQHNTQDSRSELSRFMLLWTFVTWLLGQLIVVTGNTKKKPLGRVLESDASTTAAIDKWLMSSPEYPGRSHSYSSVIEKEQLNTGEAQKSPQDMLLATISSTLEQSIWSSDTESLRRLYLQCGRPTIDEKVRDDKEVMIWAVALKIYSTLDTEFLIDYIESRFESVGEQDDV